MTAPRLLPGPLLVVVSGPAGAGKTTIAHNLARAIGCPAICRDEIKEGMVHNAGPDFEARPGDPLTMRTLSTFFDVLELLVRAGVSTVAEAAFQDKVWRPNLERFADAADIRIVHCTITADVANDRIVRRMDESPNRRAHADRQLLDDRADRRAMHDAFVPVALDVPAIHVDTTDGYDPDLATIVAFLEGGRTHDRTE